MKRRKEKSDFKQEFPDSTSMPFPWRTFTGIILGIVAVFLFGAIFSYVRNGEADQSAIQNFGVKIFEVEKQSEHDIVKNIFGVLGAYVAHLIVFYGFGIISLLLPLPLLQMAINLLRGKPYFNVVRTVKYVLVALLLFSTILAYLLPETSFSWAGEIGILIKDWLVKWIGYLGTGLLLFTILGFYVYWKYSKHIQRFWAKTKSSVKNQIDTVEPKNAVIPTEENLLSLEEEANETSAPIEVPSVSATNKATEDETLFSLEEIPQTAMPTDIVVVQPADAAMVEVVKTPAPTMPSEVAVNTNKNLIINEPLVPEPVAIGDNLGQNIATLGDYDPTLGLSNYQFPSVDMLELHGSEQVVMNTEELEANKTQIVNTLLNYDIQIQKISATVGPTVTLYEIVPAPGVRISKIKNLEDDIALSLAALGIRIIAPIPGKGTIGIEVPNVNKTTVSMRSLIASEKFQNNKFSLPIAIGKKINNENFIVDLASMPHLLMAGATGQGKSVGINALLVSLLYQKHPSQLKFVLVDPKKVELSIYSLIEKHFLAKLPGEEEAIITDTKKVVTSLNALCIEMDNRYDLLKEAACRNIKEYNEKFIKRRLNPEKGHQFLPFIVLVVDEFADLIMTAGKEVELPIARLAQLARAVGIHLIIATQRPSVNIITGTIKANFPARIAFKVSSKIDSRTILDAGGAEQLIGKGDMLISYNGEITRLQCAFVDTPEVDKIVHFIGEQLGYPEPYFLPEYIDDKELGGSNSLSVEDRDSLFEDAAKLIVANQIGSTSLIQRKMKLGYNRAGRLMDQLEMAGIVGKSQGSKPRDVLVKTEAELLEILEHLI